MKNYTAMDIANYIVWYVNNKFDCTMVQLSPLKLHKILYYVQASYLLKNDGTPLFEENIEKWQYGPVVRDVYFEFKSHGTEHIQYPHSVLLMSENESGFPEFEFQEFCEKKIESNYEDANLIKKVIDSLVEESPFTLVEWTHREPMWERDKSKIMSGERGLIYDLEEMTQYFKENPPSFI